MKNLIHITLTGLLLSQYATAAYIFTESFETDGEGTRYISSGSFDTSNGDYFIRVEAGNPPATLPAYTGYTGSAFWAAEDTDDANNPNGPAGTLLFSGISLAAAPDGFNILLDVAAGSSSHYDLSNDHLTIDFRIDGGEWLPALAFQNSGESFNTALYQDFNFDNIGTGDPLDLEMRTFTSETLTPTGSLMDIRIQAYFNAANETIAFDELRVAAIPEPALAPLILAAAGLAFRFRRRISPERWYQGDITG